MQMNVWEKKAAREYFSKTVNSLLINYKAANSSNPIPSDEEVDRMCDIAVRVVDSMFTEYPVDATGARTRGKQPDFDNAFDDSN